jgi:hypothetical protein
MKVFRQISAILALGLAAAGAAQADDSNFGVGIKAGTLGLGLEGRWQPLPFIDLRLGGNSYDLDVGDEFSGIDYDGSLDLQTFYLTGNFKFPLSPFRFTVGAFSNGNELNLASAETGDFTIGGDFYANAEVGTLTSTTSFESMAPYAGIGFDFELFGKAGLNFDLGILWQGEPTVTLAADGILADDPAFRDSLAREQADLQDDISDYKAYPVVSLAFVYNF